MKQNKPVLRSRRLALVVSFVAGAFVVAACQPVLPAVPRSPASASTAALVAQPGDIGWEGPAFTGSSGAPSGSKPESKIWFNDGMWWADMWDTTTNDFYIHRLDLNTQQWVRTPTQLDDRSNSRSDAMWDGTHLYVASHVFAEGSSATATGYPAELRRFSYVQSTGTYTLDAGFPVGINDARTESLVIEEDSVGRIWATWMQNAVIMVSVSAVGGTSFSAPTVLPVGSTGHVNSDDLSSVLAFSGNQIGVMWSNQNDQKMYFSHRLDSDPEGTWSAPEIAYGGNNSADDHINLKNVADQGGRILAAIKTSETGSSPLVVLLDRDPGTGTWTNHVFGLGTDNHTRPIVVVDRAQSVVHMFATSSQSGGSIYEKTAPLANISFPTGKGTPVLTDASSADINNATSTKQAVDGNSGLVVLATNDTTRQYWTHYDPLGGPPPPTTTSTSTSTSTTSTSTSTSTTSSTSTSTSTSTTLPQGATQTFVPTADAQVKSTSPTRNYGAGVTLRTRGASPSYASYLRFNVAGLTGAPTSAKLRLFITDASKDAGVVRATGTGWSELLINWNNAPLAAGPDLASLGKTVLGQWVEIDVTAALTGNGTFAFQLSQLGTDSNISASRESATPPQLVVVS